MQQFLRSELLIGHDRLNILKNSTVAVFGLGGVGSFAAEALARAGIGHLVLIDGDCVAESNLNRQLVALVSTIGVPKVEVMQHRIKDINPECKIEVHYQFYSGDVDAELVSANYTYIVDAIDSLDAKVHLLETAYNKKIRIISCMGMGRKLQPTMIQVADISKTHTCPMARTVRKALKARDITQGIKTVYSAEVPCGLLGESDASATVQSQVLKPRPVIGSMVFVPGTAGLVMASEVIKDILQLDH